MTRFLIRRFKTLKFCDLLSNFRSNWFIPISAIFFLLLNTGLAAHNRWPVNSYYSFVPAAIMIFLFSFICPSFVTFQFHISTKVKIFALINAASICFVTWADLKRFVIFLHGDPAIQKLVFMFLAIPFVYVVNVLFWDKLGTVLNEAIRDFDIKKDEWVIYACIYLLFCTFIAFCFLKSQAFYGTKHLVDIIYTSDSPKLLKTNAFVIIDHIENDLRQPLFAIFAAPLMGIPSLLGKIIPGIPSALFIAFSQLVLLFFSQLLFAKTLELNKIQRICFIILSSCTYTYILFSIMIDQYAIAFFWLTLTIYLMNKGDKNAAISSFASSGTLLTSGVLVPIILKPKENGFKSYKEWLISMLFYGLDFLILLLLSDRFHILWNSIKNMKLLSQYADEKLGLSMRIFQYSNFVSSYFLTPASMEKQLEDGHNSWQLAAVTSLNYIGLVIFVLAILGFIATRKSMISRIAFGWLCFSIVILAIAGWGTNENGLILYALYFGWPFLVLNFNLVKVIENKLKTNLIIPLFTAITCIVMLTINVPGIINLVEFAINKYPV